jgi:hypothetical protein
MRHLRAWSPGNQPVGKTIVRLAVVTCFAMAGLRLSAEPLHLIPPKPTADWLNNWYGPASYGAERAGIENRLEHLSGKQLVIVRYSPTHDPLDEWVYNAADIGKSKIVWAWDMDQAENLELIHYYKDRTVWLVQPDAQPAQLSPYPVSNQESAALK